MHASECVPSYIIKSSSDPSQRTIPRGFDWAQRDLSVIMGKFALSASLKSGMIVDFELTFRLEEWGRIYSVIDGSILA